MRLEIGRIKSKRGAHLEFSFQESLPSPWEKERARLDGPVEFAGRVSNTGKGYLVEGELYATASVVCDRCLEPFRTEIRDRVQEEFLPVGAKPARDDAVGDSADGEEDEELDEFNFFQGDAISVDELVHDHLLLALPQKLLCRPECKGICPRCGANLNIAECGCPAGDVDPRLAPLMDLFE